jgi:glycosyltransferase involved in cell wall biosynthesis
MKTLFITNNYLQSDSGAIYASKSFVNCFSAVSENMTLVYPVKDGVDTQDIDPRIKLIPVGDKRSKLKKSVDMLLGKLHRYGGQVHAMFDSHNYDVVVFDSSIVSYRLIKLAKDAGLKCITIHHNYQIEFVKDDTKWYMLPQTLFWTYFSERDAVRNSDLNLTLTKADSESLRIHYDMQGRFDVIGVCDFVNKDYLTQERSLINHKCFVITGQLASIQTEKSLIPWIKDYYPVLKEIAPESELIIAGRSPSHKLISICRKKGITIIPSPIDMNSILDKGAFFINPTSLGSGLKLRNMDGLRAGMQVISHEKSIRGYEKMVEGGVMRGYSDIEGFANEVRFVINNKKSKQEVLDVYKGCFSLKAGIARLNNIIEKYSIK